MQTKKVKRGARRTPGYIQIVRSDGIILKLKNMVFVEKNIKEFIAKKDNETKNRILSMINSTEPPEEFKVKRTDNTIFLIHKTVWKDVKDAY